MAFVEIVLILFLTLVVGGIGLMVVVAVAAGKAAVRAERRVTGTFYAWALAGGWQVHEGDAAPWRHRLAHLPRFHIRRTATTVVDGQPVAVADCYYQTTSSDGQGNTHTHTVDLTVFVVRLPGMWPDVEVSSRGAGSRILQSLGRRPAIEIGQRDFDRRFSVQAMDPVAAHALLTPVVVDAHLRGQAPSWSILGGELMVVEQGRLTPEGVGPGLDRLRWLASILGGAA